jgi:hypothetical protein
VGLEFAIWTVWIDSIQILEKKLQFLKLFETKRHSRWLGMKLDWKLILKLETNPVGKLDWRKRQQQRLERSIF